MEISNLRLDFDIMSHKKGKYVQEVDSQPIDIPSSSSPITYYLPTHTPHNTPTETEPPTSSSSTNKPPKIHPIFQMSTTPPHHDSNIILPNPIKHTLEPISTILRLIQLAYYPIGTKLSVQQGTIYLQIPSFFQGTIRWKNGDQRNDLHNIYEAILQLPHHPLFRTDSFQYLLPHAVYGLENLVKTYTKEEGSQLVIHSLQYYSTMIQSWMDSTVQIQTQTPNESSKYFGIWEKEELDLLKSLLELLQKKRNRYEKYDYLLEMVDSILKGKDVDMKL